MRYRPRRPSKDRTIAEWRGYWEPQDFSKYENTIDTAVERSLKSLGLQERFQEERVFELWHQLVNDMVAQNSRPIGLHRKTLQIQVLHSTVHYELERMKDKILAKMQAEFGADRIKEIQFRLG